MIKRIYDKLTGRFIRDDFNFDETTENAYIGDIPSGFYWPKYDGAKWVEGLTQAEIDAIKVNGQPIMPNLDQRVEAVETDVDHIVNALADVILI